MKRMMILPVLLAGALTLAVTTNAPSEKAKAPETVPPLRCECGCKKCPPNATLSRGRGNRFSYRECFRDENKNGICDNSVKDGYRCKNDCVAVTEEDVKKRKQPLLTPCEGCPCPADCSKCIFPKKMNYRVP